MNSKQIKDLMERAFWTFVQGFLGSFLVTIPAVVETFQMNGYVATRALIISAISGAIMAGLSALKTWVKSQKL